LTWTHAPGLWKAENSNKQPNEIKKTMQAMKEEFNKNIEILRKIKSASWK
jgi:DNA anti-recombination protein RmuC